jgi:hypothetical protein
MKLKPKMGLGAKIGVVLASSSRLPACDLATILR